MSIKLAAQIYEFALLEIYQKNKKYQLTIITVTYQPSKHYIRYLAL
jgi:hypothetical protein